MPRLEADWLRSPAVSQVMEAIGEGYFVGGCVRNTLLREPVSDIDIATPLIPDAVIDRLANAGLKSVPTGVAHGTVTAVAEGEGIEITSFRADVATDGRHATVAFTTDMTEDARRRDFTMNALYADADGTVIDPLGGLPDLQARRVRFIEDPETRIREDYLRILRFFRFHAWYGSDGLDAGGLAACANLADGLERLARERIGQEMRKLLRAPDPAPAVAAMARSGVLQRCLPGATPDMLAPLVHLEQMLDETPDWIARLVSIGGDDIAPRLRLSRREAATLTRFQAAVADSRPPAVLAYVHGAAAARGACLIRAVLSGHVPETLDSEIHRGATAQLPLAAKDLIAAGLSPGPDLGERLAQAEAAWIDSDFSLDTDALIVEALN